MSTYFDHPCYTKKLAIIDVPRHFRKTRFRVMRFVCSCCFGAGLEQNNIVPFQVMVTAPGTPQTII